MKKSAIIASFLISVFFTTSLFAGYYERGKSYYVYRNYEKAKEMFLKDAETSGRGDSYYFLGEIEKLQGNFKEAVEYYKIAITKRSINRKYLSNAYWNVMILAEQIGDLDSVIKICKEMWLRTNDYGAKKKIETLINKYLWTENEEAIKEYEKGIRLKNSGKTEEALSMFRNALSIESGFLAPKVEIGMIAYSRGEYDTAQSYLSDVAYRIDFYAEVHLILANIYYKKHSYQSAIGHFNKVFDYGFIDRNTEYFIRIKRGTCFYNTGYYDKAVEDIEEALKYRKSSIKSLLLLSAIRIKQGEYREALKPLHQAYSIKPDNTGILYQIGSIYYKESDSSHITYFTKLYNILKTRKSYPKKYNKALKILAKENFKKNNYGSAIDIIKTIKDSGDDEDYEIKQLSARSYFHLKNYDKSIEYFEKISLAGEDKFTLCMAYARSGRREKAKVILAELMHTEDYLARAKKDPSLSGIAREIEQSKKNEEKENIPTPEKRENRETDKGAVPD